jgi:signal transduction histidine kinase
MSLRARLLAAFAYTLLVVIVALEVPLSANVSDRVNAEVEADSAAQAQVVAASAADQLNDRASLQRLTRQAAVSLNGEVFIVDGHGREVASSSGGITRPPQPADDPVALQALGGEVAQGKHHEGEDILSTAVPIVRNGRTVGALEAEQSLNAVSDQVRQDVFALVGIGVLALILGLGVAWILAGSIARPLRSLGEAARRRAAGDATARAPERGSREQVQVAREFNEMADRLDAVLESQRAFVADASHQLRTPLTGLRLRLEAAGVKTSDPAVARELAAAEHETERLNQLVEDLLELASSEQPAEDDRTDLTQAARAAAERWRGPASESRHEIALQTDGDLVVRAGSRELAAILDNLVENAIKYSPSGSPVTIECAGENGSATVGVISESGPLDDEVARHAFERFYRGRGGGPGTGLGLPIVQALAKRRGGRAKLKAVEGRRVRAEVVLPAADFANS